MEGAGSVDTNRLSFTSDSTDRNSIDAHSDRSTLYSRPSDADESYDTNRLSDVSLNSTEGGKETERQAQGTFSGIGARFSAFFASAGNMLKGLFSSPKEETKKSILGNIPFLSFSSAFSSASKSLSSVKGFSFKMPSFMSSRGDGKGDYAKVSTEDHPDEVGRLSMTSDENDEVVDLTDAFRNNESGSAVL